MRHGFAILRPGCDARYVTSGVNGHAMGLSHSSTHYTSSGYAQNATKAQRRKTNRGKHEAQKLEYKGNCSTADTRNDGEGSGKDKERKVYSSVWMVWPPVPQALHPLYSGSLEETIMTLGELKAEHLNGCSLNGDHCRDCTTALFNALKEKFANAEKYVPCQLGTREAPCGECLQCKVILAESRLVQVEKRENILMKLLVKMRPPYDPDQHRCLMPQPCCEIEGQVQVLIREWKSRNGCEEQPE